jgi:hypothetical protein
MTDQTNTQTDEDSDALDILYGAAAIGRYIKRPRQFIYNRREDLGIRRLGGTLIASKSHLRKRLSQGD